MDLEKHTRDLKRRIEQSQLTKLDWVAVIHHNTEHPLQHSRPISGFLRSDGRKGIRNCIIVAYLVECAHHVAREIVDSFKGQPVHLIGFGWCYPNAYADRMMNSLCTHSNVGAVLLLSLGCENFNRHRLAENIAKSGRL
jgi:altronate dehydratase